MSRFSNDKLNLSVAAMKAMAKTLKSSADWGDETLAHAAVRAGLRIDLPEPRILMRPDGSSFYCAQPVVWLSGTSGSGKSETAHSWLRFAARGGHRTLSVTSEDAFSKRWAPEDILIIDAREGRVFADDLITALRPEETRHICVTIDVCHLAGDASDQREVDTIFEILESQAPRGMMIALDEIWWRHAPVARNFITKNADKHTLIGTTQTDEGIEELIRPEHGLVMMRSASLRDGADRTQIAQGEAWAEEGGERIQVIMPYLWEAVPSRSLTPDAQGAISRLTKALISRRPQTHMERLEYVARACGFRSWHAAEARGRGLLQDHAS